VLLLLFRHVILIAAARRCFRHAAMLLDIMLIKYRFMISPLRR